MLWVGVRWEPKGMGLRCPHFLSVFVPGLGNNPRVSADSAAVRSRVGSPVTWCPHVGGSTCVFPGILLPLGGSVHRGRLCCRHLRTRTVPRASLCAVSCSPAGGSGRTCGPVASPPVDGLEVEPVAAFSPNLPSPVGGGCAWTCFGVCLIVDAPRADGMCYFGIKTDQCSRVPFSSAMLLSPEDESSPWKRGSSTVTPARARAAA